jgi:acylphosphatase
VPPEQAACRCIVSGRVQGVFFRASTARRACELGLVGHALNLNDGRVEVRAIGPRPKVESLCKWLEVGPPQARVECVEVVEEALPAVRPESFSTG